MTDTIRTIFGDRWDDLRCEEWSISAASIADFDSALNRLDGRRHTLLTIVGEREDAHLAIGGGAGQYVVYVTPDNDEFWNVVSEREDDEVVLLVAGGQEGDYPARQVVDRETARAAGHAYLRDFSREPSVSWEKQK